MNLIRVRKGLRVYTHTAGSPTILSEESLSESFRNTEILRLDWKVWAERGRNLKLLLIRASNVTNFAYLLHWLGKGDRWYSKALCILVKKCFIPYLTFVLQMKNSVLSLFKIKTLQGSKKVSLTLILSNYIFSGNNTPDLEVNSRCRINKSGSVCT